MEGALAYNEADADIERLKHCWVDLWLHRWACHTVCGFWHWRRFGVPTNLEPNRIPPTLQALCTTRLVTSRTSHIVAKMSANKRGRINHLISVWLIERAQRMKPMKSELVMLPRIAAIAPRRAMGQCKPRPSQNPSRQWGVCPPTPFTLQLENLDSVRNPEWWNSRLIHGNIESCHLRNNDLTRRGLLYTWRKKIVLYHVDRPLVAENRLGFCIIKLNRSKLGAELLKREEGQLPHHYQLL